MKDWENAVAIRVCLKDGQVVVLTGPTRELLRGWIRGHRERRMGLP